MKGLTKIAAPILGASMVLSFMGPCLNIDINDVYASDLIYADNAADLDVGAFVNRCYEVALGRSADEDGYNYWVSLLNEGKACGAQVGYGFIFSGEYIAKSTDNNQFVKDLYKMYFDREPDSDGFDYWVGFLNSGISREEVFAGFANSTEFYNLCNKYNVVAGTYLVGVPNEQQGGINCFVSRLYKSCLNRLPDQAGQSGWVMKLANNEVSGTEISKGFIFSSELANRNLSNEEFVKVMYDAFFGRPADPDGLSMWTEKLNGGASYNLIFKGFADSAEFDNLCNTYGITRGSVESDTPAQSVGLTDLANDRLIYYFTSNVIDMNSIVYFEDEGGILCACTSYLDKDNGSVLEALSSGATDVAFCYTLDPMTYESFYVYITPGAEYINFDISLEYSGCYGSPINVMCTFDQLDEIVANITNQSYVLSNGDPITAYVEYVDDLTAKELADHKNNIDLIYANFVKTFDKGFKYWGTSLDAYGISIGNLFASYPTDGMIDIDIRNQLTMHTFENGKATDAAMTWDEYLIYLCNTVESIRHYNSSESVSTAVTPHYCLNPDETRSYIEYDSQYDMLNFYYVSFLADTGSHWNIFFNPGSDELQVFVDYEGDYVTKQDSSGFYYSSPESNSYISIVCSRSDLGKVFSSEKLLRENANISIYNSENYKLTEDLIIEMVIRDYPYVMASFDYDLNYYSTSLADGGIIK